MFLLLFGNAERIQSLSDLEIISQVDINRDFNDK